MMKLCFVVLVLAGAASGEIEKRVLGSKNCDMDRRYHVQIETVQGKKPCGASLINTRWLITAAHCANQRIKIKFDTSQMSFFKKVKSFFKGSKKNEQEIPVEQQFPYKDEEGNEHDIMLVKLTTDASGKLPTIGLPPAECTKPEVNTEVEVGGFGAKSAKKLKASSKLKCASTVISECGENDKPSKLYHSDESTTMCAFKPGVETCFGDSGSAVEHEGLLYGIVVSDPVDKCANPIVMLNICHYRKWIDETMRKNN